LLTSGPSAAGHASLPVNHVQISPVITYGQSHHPHHQAPTPLPNAYSHSPQGHLSLLPAHTGGTTRSFHGTITTTVSGVETILPTQTFLTYSPEQRETIMHPTGVVQTSGYGHVGGSYGNTASAPIDVPPGAPPPPPPVDIKTGKPLTVKIASMAGSVAPSRASTVHSTKTARTTGEKKPCSNCGHTSKSAPG
jgi:hypothetical protein